MRQALGVGVLVLGVLALGLWGSIVRAPQIEADVRRSAEAVLARLNVSDDAQMQVSGRDITVGGLASNEGGAAALIAALTDTAGRRVIRAQLTDLPLASPFTLSVVKDGAITATGFVPSEAARTAFADMIGADAVAGLTLAAGAPQGWQDIASAGLRAVNSLTTAKLSIEGETLILVGTAATAKEAAAVEADLADVALIVKDITVLDDGIPVAYDLLYNPAVGAKLAGKLPKGVTPETMAAALGLPMVSSTASLALSGEAGDIGFLSDWAKVLPQIANLRARVSDQGKTVSVELASGADMAAVQTALQAGGFYVTVENPTAEVVAPKAPEAAPETSPLGFDLTTKGCQGASDALLAATTIIFLPNETTLDDSATKVLGDLAAIAKDCAGAKLRAEIGGHTDTSGDAVENLLLSQQRAEVVRAALIAAGVPEAQLSAKGYGAAQPISENETKEGRAKNRRTTVVWAE